MSSFLTLLSCISEFSPNLPAKENDILIVGGSIVGNTTSIIYLGRNLSTTTGTDKEDYYVEGGIVTLIDSKGNESSPAVDTGKGAYQLPVGELNEDTQYGVKIIYNGNTYQSELSIPLYTPPIDSLSFLQLVPYGMVDFCVSNHNPSEEIGYYRWQFEEDWEQVVPYETIVDFDIIRERYKRIDPETYRCWHNSKNNPPTVFSTAKLRENTIINQPVFNVDPTGRFQELYCITVTQQILSRRGYEYFQNKKELSENLGGLFSPQPSMIEGNISCLTDPEKRAIGYIEINLNLVTEKLFVPQGKISWRYGEPLFCEEFVPHDTIQKKLLDSLNISWGDYYVGHRPYVDKKGGLTLDKEYIVWGTAKCLDCRLNGGVLEKPEWWPAKPEDE